MNRLKMIFSVILAFTLSGCIGWYDKMSHLSDEELAWVNCYEIGDSILFQSDSLDIDTLVVTDKNIYNTSNPFFIHFIDNYPGSNFNAIANYIFIIKNKTNNIEGYFEIEKFVENDSIKIDALLDQRFSNDWNYDFDYRNDMRIFTESNPIKITKFSMNGQLFNNCIIIDDSNSKLSKYNDRENPIASFVINRDYGLIYYRYANDKEFFRKFE